MVTQGAMNSLNPVLRVGGQIVERLLADGEVSKAEAMGRAAEIVEMVGLPREILDRYPHELSGGMKAARRHRHGPDYVTPGSSFSMSPPRRST